MTATRDNRRPLNTRERRVFDLLADGTPRTPSEIVLALVGGGGYTEQAQTSREVMPALYSLRERELVLRMVYYVAQEWPGKYVPIERYVNAASVGPVCMNCWKQRWADDSLKGVTPPQVPGFPAEYCSFCRTRTNHGTYMPREAIAEQQKDG